MQKLTANASEYVQCKAPRKQTEPNDRLEELEKRLSILENKIKD